MAKIRSFSFKRRLKTVYRCISRRRLLPAVNWHLARATNPRSKPISRLIKWTQKIGSKAKAICCRPGHGYMRMDQDSVMEVSERPVEVPKGYLAVYVGLKDGDFKRVLVPVIYFNHPLFVQLLQEAEEVFGFDNPGAITIPCRISEFEHVQTRIKKGRVIRKLLIWNRLDAT